MTSRIPKRDLRVTPPPRPDRDSGVIMSVDVEKLWKSIDKMASTINRSAGHTEQIPTIKKKVEDTGLKVVELDTKMAVASERLTRVEGKVENGHSCYKEDTISELRESQRDTSQKIELDMQKGVRQSSEIATLKLNQTSMGVDIQDIKKSPRRMFYGFIGIVITVLVYSGGAIWFLAELNKDVEFEREQRTTQFQRIEKQLNTVVNNADQSTIYQKIQVLTKAMEASTDYEKAYNNLCNNMTIYEKRFTRDTLHRRERQIPVSCME